MTATVGMERLDGFEGITVAGHRGYKSRYPENTLLAFRAALDYGADMLEFDLHLSKDGEVVVIHDDSVDRTTNGSGLVRDFTLEELKALDAGGWFGDAFRGLEIPTLRELCELIGGYPGVLLNVEIKKGPDAMRSADLAIGQLKEFGLLPRCAFTCFDAEVLAYIHDKYGFRTQGFPGQLMTNFVPGEQGTYSKMWAVGIPMELLNADIVREFEGRGIQAWCYCPDRIEQVRYALECGARLMTVNELEPAMRLRKESDLAGSIHKDA